MKTIELASRFQLQKTSLVLKKYNWKVCGSLLKEFINLAKKSWITVFLDLVGSSLLNTWRDNYLSSCWITRSIKNWGFITFLNICYPDFYFLNSRTRSTPMLNLSLVTSIERKLNSIMVLKICFIDQYMITKILSKRKKVRALLKVPTKIQRGSIGRKTLPCRQCFSVTFRIFFCSFVFPFYSRDLVFIFPRTCSP